MIYLDELEIKDTTDSASYLDILLNIDSNGRLTTPLYDKHDDFHFSIVNFHFLCSNTVKLEYSEHGYNKFTDIAKWNQCPR
jgi:hypothetical protein